MKENKFFLNTALAVIFTLALLVAVVIRTLAPSVVLPRLDIPGMVLLSLSALLADHYVARGAKRCWICVALLGAASFGVLPFAACFVDSLEALKLGLIGGMVFTAVTWLFTSMQDRLATGPAAKAAPVVSALGLYLASQCFMGLI